MDPTTIPSAPPKTPEMTAVFFCNFKLSGPPPPVYVNSIRNKAVALATVVDGNISTVPNKFGYEFEVRDIHGYDEITNHTADNYNTLDCKVWGKTPGGHGVGITYYGVIQLLEETLAVLGGSSKTSSFENTYVTSSPRAHLDSGVEDKYKWVVSENLFGKGRFVIDSDGNVCVQYYVYVVR